MIASLSYFETWSHKHVDEDDEHKNLNVEDDGDERSMTWGENAWKTTLRMCHGANKRRNGNKWLWSRSLVVHGLLIKRAEGECRLEGRPVVWPVALLKPAREQWRVHITHLWATKGWRSDGTWSGDVEAKNNNYCRLLLLRLQHPAASFGKLMIVRSQKSSLSVSKQWDDESNLFR